MGTGASVVDVVVGAAVVVEEISAFGATFWGALGI